MELENKSEAVRAYLDKCFPNWRETGKTSAMGTYEAIAANLSKIHHSGSSLSDVSNQFNQVEKTREPPTKDKSINALLKRSRAIGKKLTPIMPDYMAEQLGREWLASPVEIDARRRPFRRSNQSLTLTRRSRRGIWQGSRLDGASQ